MSVKCETCDTLGRPDWVEACGSHHKRGCERYCEVECSSCRHCAVVGDRDMIRNHGRHHDRRCPRFAAKTLAQCKYCDYIDEESRVLAAGPRHATTCPRHVFRPRVGTTSRMNFRMWSCCKRDPTPVEVSTEPWVSL
uniref:Uncharacterized protein n=1 Tax=Noctiluca scintillans TaxID=2966 RepID=A0A7S1A8T4_NOCSC|mmetsp:Transcript_36416/g.96834  ORF Transcript_36416/g.96834 Transcript_36416/m.96834 type:complete len:137 (+) Transcript_36416:142-552(+)